MKKPKAVVTGGAGYVGHRLGQALSAAGYATLLLDQAPPPGCSMMLAGAAAPVDLGPGLCFVDADVRDEAALTAHFRGASAVFHLASYGMSGGQQLQPRLIEAINVGGTQAVIGAAVVAGVERLVYLSTYNAVYGGQVIEGGDESLPYFPPHRHPDAYSRSKALAEQAVLAADGTPLAAQPGRRLRTCALRPAGIWGPGEQRHLPRIVKYLEAGLFLFTIGGPHEAIVDWLHVDNLVQANLLAAEALTAQRDCIAGGQAYFVHDDNPGVTSRVNQFEFLRPLVEGLGYPMPSLAVPARLMYGVAWMLEVLYRLLWPLCDLSRVFLLTRAEVLKSGRTHWFSCSKAREQLGYAPQCYDFKPVVQWFLDRKHGRPQRQGKGGEWRGRLRLALLVAVLAAVLWMLL